MASTDYLSTATEYRAQAAAKIPVEWHLPKETLFKISSTATISVIDIPRTSGILTAADLEITESYTATELREQLINRRFSALQVIEAFAKRAAIAQQLTNCLTETFFDQAFERAKFLDKYLAEKGQLYGPLHGIPISLKDGFNIKGIRSTLGFLSFLNNPVPTENSPLVDILLSLGAVLYVKTNVPQTLMTADSDNNLFGRTLNPHNLSLTAGGSSGGEGALVAMRGSIIGIGTDIGGSIRIPAFCDGTYGFKPSVGRIPYGGQTIPGRHVAPGIKASAGPLTNSIEDVRLLLSSVIGAKPWDYDSTALAMPWTTTKRSISPLRLGFILEDPEFPISPPIARSLKEAAQRLKAAGHTIFHLEHVPSLGAAAKLWISFLNTDPRHTNFGNIKAGNEPMVNSVAIVVKHASNKQNGPLSMDDYYEINSARQRLKKEWLKVFVENRLDAIMLPAYTTPAPPHDTYRTAAYTSLLNVLDYPGSIIPFLSAAKSIDGADSRLQYYDPEVEHRAPCHVQLMSRSQHDEELLDVTEIVAAVLKKN